MKKEITPVLLCVDNIEFDRNLHIIRNKLIPILNRIKIEFLKLGIGQMTNEFLNDILYDNFKIIKEKLAAQIKEETPSRFLIDDAVAVANKLLASLYKACEELNGLNYELTIAKDYPSVDEVGNIILTDEAIQTLRDFHSTFAMTEHGIELFEAHKLAAQAISQFLSLSGISIGGNPQEIGELFDFDSEDNLIPAFQDYDFIVARKTKSKAVSIAPKI